MYKFLFSCLLSFSLVSISSSLKAQIDEKPKKDTIIKPQVTQGEIDYQKQYDINITKSRINGVYIPIDLDEAFIELTALSTNESIEKFKNAPEAVVVQKLHYGLGRWMVVNWNLYEGSRIGHVIREYGLSHPEDQSAFLITVFHRHLNNKPLDIPLLVADIQKSRMEELAKRKKVDKIGN